jgi:hypothetical protein
LFSVASEEFIKHPEYLMGVPQKAETSLRCLGY